MGSANENKYIVVDVETPNSKNDSLCSIAYVLVDGETIVDEGYTLVDPKDVFERFNINIHGITPDMVVGAPEFISVWNALQEKSKDRVFVAHNAQFDLTVLSKALENHKLPQVETDYLCTVQLAKAVHFNNCNVRGDLVLSQLAKNLGVELTKHHNALYDARACACILIKLFEMYEFDVVDFVKKFSHAKHTSKRHPWYNAKKKDATSG